MNKTVRIAWAVVALLLSSARLHGETVTAEGSASIRQGGIERARQAAIEDARSRAAMQAGIGMDMTTIVTPRGVPLESSRVRIPSTTGPATVLREWQQGDDLHVLVAVEVTAPDGTAGMSLRYKKKVTATPFPVRRSSVTDDIENVHRGIARELLRRLEASDRFLATSSEQTLPFNQAEQGQNGEAVVRLADAHDSQFVIAGEIVDAGAASEGGVLGLFEHQRRRFDIDVVVYDGLTGSKIAQHRIEKSATGEVAIGRDKPFGSAAFYATSYGKAIGQTLDEAARLIARDLANLPFAARVIRTEGDRIYIDAGANSLIAPGDKLVAYRLRKELPLNGYGSGAPLGVSETPIGTITIVQVQPKFSTCTLFTGSAGAKVALDAGDIVRFDFTSQRQVGDRPDLF